MGEMRCVVCNRRLIECEELLERKESVIRVLDKELHRDEELLSEYRTKVEELTRKVGELTSLISLQQAGCATATV